jgi:hypothetical protein
MEAAAACKIINDDLVFQPDWDITAKDNTHRFEDCVTVHMEFFAYDSSREHFTKGTVHLYPTRIHVESSVQVADCHTPEDLMFKILELILRTYEHEAREFLRLKSKSMAAPFHPHKPDTMLAYAERTGRGAAGLVHDLTYGLG